MAASVAEVMLVEFVAVSRALSALTARPITPIVRAMAAALVEISP